MIPPVRATGWSATERLLLCNPTPIYSVEQRRSLLRVAAKSLAHGIEARRPLRVDALTYDQPLQQIRGTFVTLRRDGRLRGCMGTLKARRSLVEDVAHNAYASATRDPRFEAVTADEVLHLSIQVSVLSDAVPIEFSSREDLLGCIRPGVDGLIVRSGSGSHTGTLLPAVWDYLPDVAQFWEQLLAKAGLPADYWDDDLTVQRYTAESFGGKVAGESSS